ncbi:hypothetical protein V6N11_066079 [Hibiscus sabdariffa]|uniref:Uncharacterized protein n=1 Tax=Hibiscus sabdariffa TaxID=183260 RepID=A0ABR2NUR4_9ROSI
MAAVYFNKENARESSMLPEYYGLWKQRACGRSRAPLCSNDKGVDMMNESFWTDVDFVRENLDPSLHSYVVSKTLIERAALEFGAEHGLNVVTLIPTYVVGPFICPKLPETLCSPLGLVLGTELGNIDLNISMVHKFSCLNTVMQKGDTIVPGTQ